MDISIAFGRTLKKWRRARGYTQADLALRAQLDRTFISLLERGSRQPTLTTVFVICKVLQVAPSDLIHQTERLAKTSLRRSAKIASQRL